MKKFVSVVMLSIFAQTAMADVMGLGNGRSANLDNMADMSVEAGLNVNSDETLFGARVNFKVSSDLMLFGDVGMYSDDTYRTDADGLVYGLGAFYQLRNITVLENTDFAVKGAYHLGTLEVDENNFGVRNVDVDYSEITIEALISGDQVGDTDFGWYANAGIHIIERGSDDKNKPVVGGGVTKPLSIVEFFAGLDLLDGARLVAGLRYSL